MQAARRCCVTRDPEGAALFAVEAVGEGEGRSAASEGVHEENAEGMKSGIRADGDGVKEEVDVDGEKSGEEAERGANKPKDPIRMFGILTPQALWLAQGVAIKIVEDVVPRLVSIDAEMKEVEIKIRERQNRDLRRRLWRKQLLGREKRRILLLEGTRIESLIS